MSKFKLTSQQKEEIRRLTQLANRRIKTAEKQYREMGKTVAPRDVVGHVQTRAQWHTDKTPLSRSVVFDSEQEYKERLRLLQSFDPKARGMTRPTITAYTKIQREKTAMAVQSSLGDVEVPREILDSIENMTAPQLSEFWRKYSEKSSKLLMRYSSLQAMQETLNEIFPEDMQQLEGISNNIGG